MFTGGRLKWAARSGSWWLLLLLTLAAVYVGVPWIWVRLQGPVWGRLAAHLIKTPKYEDIETVARHYFDPKKYESLKARTVVFGHTHYPGYVHFDDGDEPLGNWTFVNSGSWVRPPQDASEEIAKIPHDTLVYIDEKGPHPFSMG